MKKKIGKYFYYMHTYFDSYFVYSLFKRKARRGRRNANDGRY